MMDILSRARRDELNTLHVYLYNLTSYVYDL